MGTVFASETWLNGMEKRTGSWHIDYGKVMLKQVGMMAMIGSDAFDKGDFSSVEKVMNTVGAGVDWLIIGYTDEPMFERLKDIEALNDFG